MPRSAEISAIERQMDQRRDRIAGRLNQARRELEQGARWLPLVGLGALLLLGFSAGRGAGRPAATRGGRRWSLASLAALVASAMRFASSPAVASLWRAFGPARDSRLR
jgi:hypothetical protein